MKSLRERVAREEGVIKPSDPSGRPENFMGGDDRSWHLLRLGRDGRVAGCARILVHPRNVSYNKLRIASCSVARSSLWGRRVRDAVESELDRARSYDLNVIEPGGWVVDESLRGTGAAVSIALSAFAWAQLLGGCIGFLTATVEHGSSAILRRLGGHRLESGGEAIPRHFEPAWGCNMEVLRFDTNSLSPRFATALSAARSLLMSSTVFSCEPQPSLSLKLRYEFEPLQMPSFSYSYAQE